MSIEDILGSASAMLPTGFTLAGRYEVIRTVGAGGMGNVYLIKDLARGGEELALKVLHPDFTSDKDLLQRFLREVQLMSRVRHPNVVRTFDIGNEQNLVYFTMEYVPGSSLDKLIKERRVQRKQLPSLIIQISEALDAIHKVGIIHRDLKPGNVIVLNDGTIKLTDFGVARPEVSELTAHNEIIGSVCYIAPEIWLGETPTPSVDLYSLGVVLYELATGEVPFDGGSPGELMRYHLDRQPVPPKEKNPSSPSWLNKLILRLLAKSPQERPRDAREVIDYVRLHGNRRHSTGGTAIEPTLGETSGFYQALEEQTKKHMTIVGERPSLISTSKTNLTAYAPTPPPPSGKKQNIRPSAKKRDRSEPVLQPVVVKKKSTKTTRHDTETERRTAILLFLFLIVSIATAFVLR